MYFRVAVHLAGRRLQYSGSDALGQSEHVDNTVDARLRGLDRVILVVNWRCRACEVVDFINLDEDRKGYVMSQELEIRFAKQMPYIVLGACEEVVDAQNIVACREQLFAQVGSEESGTTGYCNPFSVE